MGVGGCVTEVVQLTPDLSSMILIPDSEMLTQILCLCLPWERAASAMPWVGGQTNAGFLLC